MTEADLLKYKKSLEKIITESTILGLSKIPNICDRYMERLIKFFSITVEYSIEKEKDPKKCVRNVKKLESSPEYIDLLENCLVPKLKHIDKIFKKYPKTGKKLIVIAKKMIAILEKKIEKMDKNNEKKMDASCKSIHNFLYGKISIGMLRATLIQNRILSTFPHIFLQIHHIKFLYAILVVISRTTIS